MKYKLYLVDDNEGLINLMLAYFKDNNKIEVVATGSNGDEAIKYLSTDRSIDLVVLDLIMPIKDGIHVIDELNRIDHPAKKILCTSFNQQDTIAKISRKGVNFILIKPYEFEDLEKRILDILEDEKTTKKEDDYILKLEVEVSNLLHTLGVPSHIKGYTYLRDVIVTLNSNTELTAEITKSIYPFIATKYGTTAARVERAMRHAIEVGFKRGNKEIIKEVFGSSISMGKTKPTNAEFIYSISDKIRLDHQMKKLK